MPFLIGLVLFCVLFMVPGTMAATALNSCHRSNVLDVFFNCKWVFPYSVFFWGALLILWIVIAITDKIKAASRASAKRAQDAADAAATKRRDAEAERLKQEQAAAQTAKNTAAAAERSAVNAAIGDIFS
jgi:hypothetical protein